MTSEHPYQSIPDTAYWRRSVANLPHRRVDPVVRTKFRISRTDGIMTLGSCFAQHISRRLERRGYNFLVTETAHPILGTLGPEMGYGVFTARYGNVYTARQLVQLFDRAYGVFQPADSVWTNGEGKFVDPFRPQIQPGGFLTAEELLADRERHFACVRQAFETHQVLVFTLGLTELWRSKLDGAAFPLCPGVAGGTFDSSKHEFHDLSAQEVASDLAEFLKRLLQVNPNTRVLLTVSPVPLVATASSDHVLVATVRSKSILRVAADVTAGSHDAVDYFPSYEIITGQHARGSYFEDDLRSVTESGVSHVMQVFFRHYGNDDGAVPGNAATTVDAGNRVEGPQRKVAVANGAKRAGKKAAKKAGRKGAKKAASRPSPDAEPNAGDEHYAEMKRLTALACDEEALDRGVKD
ncbi:MAG TPA: GSCFA domain-containing protein [Pirellulaceae bacterium]|nr:GSCFA domain-containing protein [Pirellulaceae bacterium]